MEGGYLAEPAEGAAEPEGVRVLEVGEGEDAFFGVGAGFEKVAAKNAGEGAGGERRGEELAGSFDEEVADGAFGELTSLVEEDDVVEAVGSGGG